MCCDVFELLLQISKFGLNALDSVRQSTIDELSSIAIWTLIILVYLELISYNFGFGLKSFFAFGGSVH